MSSLHAWFLGVALLCGSFALRADSAPVRELQVPKNDGWVTDLAGLIPDSDERALEADLEAWKRKTGHEIAVLTVPSLKGESLERVPLETFRAWGLGSKERSDGALLFIARDDRKMRIEVGRGLEGSLTDSISGRIIRDVIAPHFKRGDFSGGIKAGVEAMKGVVDGNEKALPPERSHDDPLVGTLIALVIVFVIFAILVRASRGGSRNTRGRRGPFGGFGGFGGLGGLGGMGGLGGGRSSGGGFGGFGGFGGGGGASGGGASGGW